MIINLVLYSTSHCHLCEQAELLLRELTATYELNWTIVEIADDSELLALYEVRIPVLKKFDSNIEISWPFDETDIELLISDINH